MAKLFFRSRDNSNGLDTRIGTCLLGSNNPSIHTSIEQRLSTLCPYVHARLLTVCIACLLCPLGQTMAVRSYNPK